MSTSRDRKKPQNTEVFGACFGDASRLRARSRFGSADPPDPHSPPNRPSSNRRYSAASIVGVPAPNKTAPARGAVLFGGATRNRTGDEGFADPCLTAWPWRRNLYEKAAAAALFCGAGNGARTRHLSLGKAALYQMSYSRRMVPQSGLEPPTQGFSVPCSTN